MQTLTCHLKPYIQPFERILALRELEAIAGGRPYAANGDGPHGTAYVVRTERTAGYLARRLAYWEHVVDTRPIVTRQVRFEAASNGHGNGTAQGTLWDDETAVAALPNRRCLRFGPHGIHEYRGKFFPQLVRALLNWAELPRRSLVLDPMCGSGTTCVEAAILGHRSIGLDMNPLSVLMTRAKCELLRCEPSDLASAYQACSERLRLPEAGKPRWLASMAQEDQDYLRSWFAPEILRLLERIAAEVIRVPDAVARDLLLMSLSNVLRRVSWQKDDDLRVRRDAVFSPEGIDPTAAFLEEARRSVETVTSFLNQLSGQVVGPARALEGDARRVEAILGNGHRSVAAVVTSPPYATALPYIDTDRLSLLFLKLLPRGDHRAREQLMIGNREITDRARRHYWESFQRSRDVLPRSITSLVERIERLNRRSDVGFRRRNMGALLGRYFLDMREVLYGLSRVVRRRAPVFFVVGDNHTYAGGERTEIKTAQLLGELAESLGCYVLEDSIPMEMLVSRDIFRRNATASETTLCLRRS